MARRSSDHRGLAAHARRDRGDGAEPGCRPRALLRADARRHRGGRRLGDHAATAVAAGDVIGRRADRRARAAPRPGVGAAGASCGRLARRACPDRGPADDEVCPGSQAIRPDHSFRRARDVCTGPGRGQPAVAVVGVLRSSVAAGRAVQLVQRANRRGTRREPVVGEKSSGRRGHAGDPAALARGVPRGRRPAGTGGLPQRRPVRAAQLGAAA